MSYFVRKTDNRLGNIAVFEYKGKQPGANIPHGNARSKEEFVRKNPKTFDKIQQKIKNNQQPREIFADLKHDDSLTCPRDFGVIRSKKNKDKKKEQRTITTTSNIADEILDVIGMINEHPYVQTIVHNKDQVPSVICYTADQMTDLRHFLKNDKSEPLGIDRTFNLGSFYVTTIVYKNQRVVRKEAEQKPNNDVHPIFMGPVLLHKEANYKVYKTFLEHVATEVDNEIETVELRVSDKMEFGSDDEKALTKAIEHVFPLTERLLCTKHLKDNIKHYCQNKVGMPKNDREMIMARLFSENGLADANSTVDFDNKCHELESSTKEKYPVFARYLETNLEPRLRKHVFQPNRKRHGEKMWTNNNAESLNNILKLSTDWRPKSTQELIQKLHNVTKLQFSDYRSALHDTENYRLAGSEKLYLVNGALWRCKSEEEKQKIFAAFLSDKKKKQKQKYITSKNGKLSVPNKATGTAKKPHAKKRPLNVRTQKRW